jgi:tRNA(Ile2) C34 agmatinyltransferase TiaS
VIELLKLSIYCVYTKEVIVNLDKLNRSITLLCPTCGNSEMESLDGPHEVSSLFKCNSCDLEITKEDLINSNQENINANLNEVKTQATKEIQTELNKMLKNAFKGNKNIKFK